MGKVLILDGSQRSALAATRSLGRQGIAVIVADATEKTLAGSSRYCQGRAIYPSPVLSPEGFIESLRKEVLRREITVLLPMTDITTYSILKHRDAFPGVSIPFAPFEAFEALSDKWKLDQLARELKINVPKTYLIRTGEEIRSVIDHLKFPVVMKPYCSKIFSNGKWATAPVRYASSAQEIYQTVSENKTFQSHPFLIQEYICGKGQGVFALYDRGKPVAFFAHRRLREKPPSGGISVLSESVALDPALREIACRILDRVSWHGVAMIELKVTAEGVPYLIEVNARFWGSLQLAVDAGVDFPWLLYQLAIGKPVSPVEAYQVGIQSRWLLGDLDHLYLKLKERKNPVPFSEKCRSVAAFLKFFGREMRYEINRWDDFKPFLHELKSYLKGG